MSQKWFPLFCAGLVMFVLVWDVSARGPMVSALGNKHNLSAQNTGVTYHAVDDALNNPGGQQICIFCHTPHNSQPQGPLWNRKDTPVTNFARYSSSTLKIGTIAASQYSVSGDAGGQPNGSSRLCLSCHDGVTGFGDVIRSGQAGPIEMQGGDNIPITDVASFHPSTNKMKVGHHPVSFVYATSFNYNTQAGTMIGVLDPASFKIPAQTPDPQMAEKVKLQDSKRDSRGWMQCTTCHDPHQNMGNDADVYPATTRKISPFWVYSGSTAVAGHDAVCSSCHLTLLAPYNVAPWPTP